MGAGPSRLRDLFPDVAAEEINPRREFRAEIATSFELYGLLSQRIAQSEGFPVVLSGNLRRVPGNGSRDLMRTLEQVRARFDVVALDLASYDPSRDRDGRIFECARRVATMFPER